LKDWDREGPLPLGDYAEQTTSEVQTTATLVAACYWSFPRFQSFADLSMLYFVAASYAEMARRLGRFDLAPGFLLRGREDFHQRFMSHCQAALAGEASSAQAIAAGMEPYNIAGLCDPARENWYPVELEDTLRGAAKLEATEGELLAAFEACGLGCERKGA
jgi:tetracycline 7-halogenase / FADH2 O2-dependent halogenase